MKIPRKYAIFHLLIALIFFSPPLLAENVTQEQQTEQATPQLETQELHLLNNEDLLKQTNHIYSQAVNTLRSQVRGMVKTELMFNRAHQEFEDFEIPKEVVAEDIQKKSKETLTSLDIAKLISEARQARLEAFQNKLALSETQKANLDEHITQIENTQIAIKNVLESIKTLEPFVLEIELRKEDGTLPAKEIPDVLTKKNLDRLSSDIAKKRAKTETEIKTAHQDLKTSVNHFETIKQDIITAEAQYDAAKKKYAQELKRQTMEQEYLASHPTSLLKTLADFQEEFVWLEGAFNLSLSRFNSRKKNADERSQKLEALTKPETELLQLETIRSEEIEQAIEEINQLTTYDDERIQKLSKFKSSLMPVIEKGEIFQGDATVLSEHIFKMQVLAGVLEKMVEEEELKLEDIPEESRTEALVKESDAISVALSDARSVTQQAKEKLTQLDIEIDKIKKSRQELKERLVHFQKINEATQKAMEWDEKLKSLSAEQILKEFKKDTGLLDSNKKELDKARQAYHNAKAATDEIKGNLDSLKDPLLRLAQEESATEKREILKKLYGYADLELPTELQSVAMVTKLNTITSEESTEVAETVTTVDEIETDTEKKQAERKAQVDEIIRYQNLLSMRHRILKKQHTYEIDLLTSLKALSEQIEAFAIALSGENKFMLEHYANAVELKKRLGRKQLSSDAVPSSITEALNRDRITEIELEISALTLHRTEVNQQIEALSQPDETLDERQTLLTDIMNFVGKRLDILEESHKLEQIYDVPRDQLSEVELKSLEQAISRRLSNENSFEEKLFQFLPSGEAENLADLLKFYYSELLDVESKQSNLKSQKDKAKLLIKFIEDEKTSIEQLLPFLQEQLTLLENEYEEEWVKVQARLKPEEAESIISNFETKTGRQISLPPPIPKDQVTDTLKEINNMLFEEHVYIVAANKWVDLFEKRLSIEGLGTEIGQYQDKLGDIDAKAATLVRHMKRITGHPQSDLDDMSVEDRPKTSLERQRFLSGEIGVLRAERQGLLRQAATWVLIKVAMIYLIALLISKLLSGLIHRTVNRAKETHADSSPQTIFVLTFLNTLIKTAIWIVAIIMMLSSVGFNIGAILAGLGIGGLAVAMAARESLANILGGVMIFLERPFKIGDVIKVDSASPKKVVDMTWRSTRLEDAFGYHYSIPNNDVANAALTNYSTNLPTGDYITVSLSPDYDPNEVMKIMTEALEDCGDAIIQDKGKGTMFYQVALIEEKVVAQYWPWWYINDYQKRSGARQAVWLKIIEHLKKAGMSTSIDSSIEVKEMQDNKANPFMLERKELEQKEIVESEDDPVRG